MTPTKKVCETCKFEYTPWFEEPCHHCDVNTYDKWEPKDEKEGNY